MNWKSRPTFADYVDDSIDYLIFIDENGDTNLNSAINAIKNGSNLNDGNRYLTVTACVMSNTVFRETETKTTALKYKYWSDGLFPYNGNLKRVCFHSRDIRNRECAFGRDVIDYDAFCQELDAIIKQMPITLFSSHIDKLEHCQKYYDPHHVYSLCLDFIVERIVKWYIPNNKTCAVILETRGKKEDKVVHSHMKSIITNGTNKVSSQYFSKVRGVYFNPKWSKLHNDKMSYFGLEYADLFSYHIHKKCVYGTEDRNYNVLKLKFYHYPLIDGYGLKKFP